MCLSFDMNNSILFTNGTVQPRPGLHFDVDTLRITLAFIYSVIFAIGVPGNVLVILIIVRTSKMRSVKNIFIANLAVGDLINLMWCLPTDFTLLFHSWPFGEFVCKYISPIADVIICNTIVTMVLITSDRYRAIVYPFTEKPTLKKTVIVLIISWFFCYAVVGLPLVEVARLSLDHKGQLNCTQLWNKSYEMTYRFVTFVLQFLIPFLVISISFLRIKKRLEENISFVKTSLRGRNKFERARKNKRLIKMLFIMFLCFTLCYLPASTLIVTLTVYPEIAHWKFSLVVFKVALAMLFLNSMMNPVILFLLSRDYRLGYIEQIRCLCPHSKKIQVAANALQRISTTSVRMKSAEDSSIGVSLVEATNRYAIDDSFNQDSENERSDVVKITKNHTEQYKVTFQK